MAAAAAGESSSGNSGARGWNESVSGRGKRKAPRAVSGREGGLVASSLLVFCFRFCSARRESHFRFEFKQQGGAAAGDGGRPGPGEGFSLGASSSWQAFAFFSSNHGAGKIPASSSSPLLDMEKEASGFQAKAKSLWQAPFFSPPRDRLIRVFFSS